MNEKEIENILSSSPITKNCFHSVISYEELPQNKQSPDCNQVYIVNTDEIGDPGIHWVAIFLSRNETTEFFDSLGHPPEYYSSYIQSFLINNGPEYIISSQRIQGRKPVCGNYCILYCYFKCLGYSMSEYIDMFSQKNEDNDLLVTF